MLDYGVRKPGVILMPRMRQYHCGFAVGIDAAGKPIRCGIECQSTSPAAKWCRPHAAEMVLLRAKATAARKRKARQAGKVT
jgi:hypothetical protein